MRAAGFGGRCAEDLDGALGGFGQACKEAEEGGFAGTVFAQDEVDLAGREGEGDRAQRGKGAEELGDGGEAGDRGLFGCLHGQRTVRLREGGSGNRYAYASI